MLDPFIRGKILAAQKNEATEHLVYKNLAGIVKIKEQAGILESISAEEFKHYGLFKAISGADVAPDRGKVFFYTLVSRLFGLNFGLKLMENGEDQAQDVYDRIRSAGPEIENIISEEKAHEAALLDLIDEDHLLYTSAIVLGLNDALVELTASLAGFTLALQNCRLIGIVGLITGIAASASMAAAEYLSTKNEKDGKDPVKACVYTGAAYILTVILLVLPFFLSNNIFLSLGLVVGTALSIILIFTFYISVAQGFNFKKRFLEMAGISLGISVLTFLIGFAVRSVFKVDV